MSLVVFIDVLLGVIFGCFLGIFIFIIYCKNRKPLFMKEMLFEDNESDTTQDCNEHSDVYENKNSKKVSTESDPKEIDDRFLESIYDSKCRGADILFEQQEINELARSKTINEYFDKPTCENSTDSSEILVNYHDNETSSELDGDSADGQLSFDELMHYNTSNKTNSVVVPQEKNTTKSSPKRIIVTTNDNNKNATRQKQTAKPEPLHCSNVSITVSTNNEKNKESNVNQHKSANSADHKDEVVINEKKKIEITVPTVKNGKSKNIAISTIKK